VKRSPVPALYRDRALRGQAGRNSVLSATGWAVLLFLLALAPRLPGLRLFLTTDEPFFVQEAAQVSGALLRGDFQGTYWHFYPGVTISWLNGLGLGTQWLLARITGMTAQPFEVYVQRNILDLILAARLPYVLLAAAGVAGFYLLARRLLGHRVALLGALFIAFDPFFLAHSRVAHGDAPVTVFMGLSALAFFVYLQATSRRAASEVPGAEKRQAEGERRWLILSAVMGALAALTKAPGPFMVLFVILVGVGDWLITSRFSFSGEDSPAGKGWRIRSLDWQLARRRLTDLVLWGGVAVLLFVALWPAMWVDPVGTIARMLNETFGKVEAGHLVFFMGQPTLDPGPWFYPYVICLRLTPITLIGMLASGLMVIGKLVDWKIGRLVDWKAGRWVEWKTGGQRDTARRHFMAAAWFWVFIVALLLFGDLSPKKQDRYLLPLFPFLDLLAAFAFVEISRSASQRVSKWINTQHATRNTQYAVHSTQYAIRLALPLLLLIIHILPTLSAYPYYLAYFNPLLGGLPRALQTTLVGWGEGMEQVAAYLNQRPHADQLYVAAVPAQTFLPYFRGRGENFYTNDVALRADYVVLYVSQLQRLAPSPEIVRYFRAMDAEHTVYVRGVPYAWIYPGPKLITGDVPSTTTLTNVGFGDQLRLAGYQISKPESPVSSLEVALYWHALAPMNTDYSVSVRLVAPDGTWVAQHDGWPAGGLLPTTQWRPGDYVRDAHSLALPASVTSGEYALQVVIYDAMTGAALNEPLAVTTLMLEGASP
jgi:4-amino-4-deoxy-L-arabinose transferase-like glycosyltransferase